MRLLSGKKLLSRKEFIQICTQAILVTKRKIVIYNQISGYQKYDEDNQESAFWQARKILKKTNKKEFILRHDLIEYIGLGFCNELADFLLIEIGKRIDKKGATAGLRIISSKACDHVYLEIKIKLLNEKKESVWEVDAWDPRIIDISPRPNGSTKNSEYLHYGYEATILNNVSSNQINYKRRQTFFNLPKPQQISTSKPLNGKNIKIGHIYNDHTIEKAEKEKLLSSNATIHYPQKVSNWQLTYPNY